MDKDTLVKVTNRDNCRVGYKVPDLGVNRQFAGRETKEIPFGELQSLSYISGGDVLLKEYLVIKDAEALKALGIDVEPEYFYTEEEVKKLFLEGSLDQFKDCLDFAPDGVLDMVKDLAVTMPLNDMSKRKIILDKLNFDVTNAIEIRNTKFDGGDADDTNETKKATRRAATPIVTAETGRRTATPIIKVVEKTE